MPTIVQLVNATTGIEVHPKTQLAAIVDWSSATSSFVTSSGDAQTITSRKTFNNASGIAISNGTTTANFYVDANGYLHTNLPLISDSFIGAYGATSSSGGGGGGATIDLSSVWLSLTTHDDDYANSKIDINHLPIATSVTQNNNNPVSSGAVYTALLNKQATLNFDVEPVSGGNNPVTSGGIYTALQGKQDTLSFDSQPTSGSEKLVKSGGIYNALYAKQDTLTADTGIRIYKSNGLTYIASSGISGIVCNNAVFNTQNGNYNSVVFNLKINGSTSGVTASGSNGTNTVNLTIPTISADYATALNTAVGDGSLFLCNDGSWQPVQGGSGGGGGEVNVINAVKVNGTSLSVTNKSVNLKINLNDEPLNVSNDTINISLSGYATTAALASKQNILTAGEGITIVGNVISATGGSGGGGTSGVTSVDTRTGAVSLEDKYIQLNGSGSIRGSLSPYSSSNNCDLGTSSNKWRYIYGQDGYFYGLNLSPGGSSSNTLYIDSNNALHCTVPFICDSYVSAYGAGNSANVINQMWAALAGNTSETINVSHMPDAAGLNYGGGSVTLSDVITFMNSRITALENAVNS